MSANPQLNAAHIEESNLRTAMALNRGIEWVEKVKQQAKSTKGDYAALRLGHLEQLFHDTHHQLFQDWNGNNDKVSGENRIKIREAIDSVFFSKGKNGMPNGLFDEHGFAIRFEPESNARIKFSEKLAEFYEKMRAIDNPKPYSYGNKLTLDFFMVALSKIPAVAAVYPEGLDFRKLDKDDLAAMAQNPPSHDAIMTAFNHATDPGRIRPLMNHSEPQGKNGYRVWEDHTETVGGTPFLSHLGEDGIKYLVTMNGGLVKLDQIKNALEDHLKKDGLIYDFLTKAEKYLDAPGSLNQEKREELKGKLDILKKSTEISGVEIKEGEAPLVCLDVNIMSGLRPDSHNKLMEFLENNKDLPNPNLKEGKEIKITILYNKEIKGNKIRKEEFLKPWMERAGDNNSLKNMLGRAYDLVNANMRQIDRIVEDKCKDIPAQATPGIFVSMGGSGSGKSVVDHLVAAECGKNFVTSSLDSFREYSDFNTLLLAAKHHSDDYAIVNPYAEELRKGVIDRALEKKINILCDGSGIDYKGRNDKTVRQFKAAGFHTQIIAVEADYKAAVERVDSRYDTKNRAMPWIRVADKHVNFPISLLDALADRNVDKISLVAADRENRYLVAETVDKAKQEVKALNGERKTGLLAKMKDILSSDSSIAGKFKKIDKNITDIPAFTNENTTFLTYPGIEHGGKERIFAVYNISRLTGLMEKGILNPYANSPEKKLLRNTKDGLSFYMPEPSAEPGAWQLHLQNEDNSSPIIR